MNRRLLALTLLLAISSTHSFDGKVKRALQKSHEKSQSQKWSEAFFGKLTDFDQVPSLVNLITMIANEYLNSCYSLILYDQIVENNDGLLLEQLFRNFPFEYTHGQITNNYTLRSNETILITDKCVNYILFMADLSRSKEVIGEQNVNKVIVVARSSQWRVYEFLASDKSHDFVNLLVIAQSEKFLAKDQELPFILYTHKLYTDGLGSSEPRVLTTWVRNGLTRPHVSLFPTKITEGFASHRFICSVGHQPPFVIKTREDNSEVKWDGVEIRLMQLMAKHFNFTTDFREAPNYETLGSGEAVVKYIHENKAEIGLAGLYATKERIAKVDLSQLHSQDCASFISLTSTALPRYRAIMGPFHWVVWMTLTFVYLFAIFPIAFSDKHTLRHLVKSPEEIENMFWYVFGTFTNCFTFVGKNSWSKSSKAATRLLIGFYWLFTIIISACYTGSIIAFVTLPVFPKTVDTVAQFLDGGFRIGLLDKGGWEHWYDNLTDPAAAKLLHKKELLPSVEMGLKNTTKAFFWSYAFLGSRAELDYIVRTNFTTTNKRSVLHISTDCFVPYGVSLAFAQKSNYKVVLDQGIMHAVESGFIIKFINDVEWEIMRSATGKLLQVSGAGTKILSVEDRALTLDDTQGMFLLLGVGFLAGGASLVSEIFGGCFNLCKRKVILRRASLVSNPRAFDVPTPREKLDSIQMNNHFVLHGNALREENASEREANSAECVVHKNDDVNTNYDEEIDKLFNMDELFGEENIQSEDGRLEELKEDIETK